MTACDGTASVAPQAKKHMVLLCGTFTTGGERILARAHLQQSSSDSGGVRMKVSFFFAAPIFLVFYCCSLTQKPKRL